ncbi:MAG: dipeptidase [Acidobacteriota bacterium]|nr:MAG: dipeptidase [Acidobacteriota bacterium]
MSTVAEFIRDQRERHLELLEQLLSIPSISTDADRAGDVRRAAEWVRDRLNAAGCQLVELHETSGHPLVYGEWSGVPGEPTVLVYGHYDVQPVDPLELWTSPPFEPTQRDGKLYARGASDDKGQFTIHINALEAHLRATGSCPVNIKFLLEGEEEIGSPNLRPFIAANRDRLKCDVVVISDTAMFAKGVPSICHGLRGLAYLQINVTGTKTDLHSGSYGGGVVNPANALTEMLASLKDRNGKIRVPGFYDNVRRMTREERLSYADLPHKDSTFRRGIGAPALFGEKGFTTLERLWARPSLDVNGIWSGFTGKGAKTVIPATAHAKISARLVPFQASSEITRKLSSHLKKIAPASVKVTVEALHGGEPWLAPKQHPALQATGQALQRAFGKKAVFVLEGGSIPIVADFDRMLRVPCVLMGIGLPDDGLHAPNEKIDLSQHFRGIEAAAFLLEELASASRERAAGVASRAPRVKKANKASRAKGTKKAKRRTNR